MNSKKIKSKLHVYESRNADLMYVTVDVAIANLKQAGEGIVDPTVDIETVNRWGDTEIVCSVSGYRPATAEDKATLAAEKREQEERQRQAEERQVEQLRKSRPELFVD